MQDEAPCSYQAGNFRGRIKYYYFFFLSCAKIFTAACIPKYFRIHSRLLLYGQKARVNAWRLSARTGGEQTRAVRSCPCWLCLCPVIHSADAWSLPAPAAAPLRHGHVSLLSSNRVNAALMQGLQLQMLFEMPVWHPGPSPFLLWARHPLCRQGDLAE